MARLLADAKGRARAGLESDSDLEERAEAEIIPKLAEEHGIRPLIEKIQPLRKDLKSAEKELERRGFSCDDDGDISVRWRAPKKLCKALEEAKRSAQEERDAELTKYDRAILSVWAAETPAEAKKIVEELL